MSYTLAVLTPRVLFQPLLVMMSCVDQYCMLFCLFIIILSHFYPPSLSFFEEKYNTVPFFNFNPLYFLHSPSSSTTVLATASSSLLLLLPLLLRVLWASSLYVIIWLLLRRQKMAVADRRRNFSTLTVSHQPHLPEERCRPWYIAPGWSLRKEALPWENMEIFFWTPKVQLRSWPLLTS